MTDEDKSKPEASAETQTMLDAARADEQQAQMQARIKYLEERTVLLNLEVRIRDQRISELQQDLMKFAEPVDGEAEQPPVGDE